MGAREDVAMGVPEDDFPEDAEIEEAPEESTLPDGFLKNVLVAACLGAGAIHIWAAWAHSAIPRVLIFFTVVATLQLWIAAAIIWVRSVPWSMLFGGAIVNAVTAVVWVLSRTTGVPFQPESMKSMDAIMSRALSDPNINTGAMSHQESFGLLDSVASGLEVVAVVAVVVLWMKRRSQVVEPETDETISQEVR